MFDYIDFKDQEALERFLVLYFKDSDTQKIQIVGKSVILGLCVGYVGE